MFLSSFVDFFVETRFKVKLNNVVSSFLDAYYVKLLHYLYNECDFLNEEEILEWFEKQEKANEEAGKKGADDVVEIRKYANKKLEPFIKWLREADEDDDEDEEDEDE